MREAVGPIIESRHLVERHLVKPGCSPLLVLRPGVAIMKGQKKVMVILKESNKSSTREAAENAYIPYSQFRVGAALLTKNGRIFQDLGIENTHSDY